MFDGSFLVGHQVREFRWPANALLIGVHRGERQIIPHGDTILRAGDTLIVETQHDNRAFIRERIAGMAEQISVRGEDWRITCLRTFSSMLTLAIPTILC